MRLLLGTWVVLSALSTLVASADLERARQLHRGDDLDGALREYRGVIEEGLPSDVAIALNNTCLILQSRGELEEAARTCSEALAFRRQVGDQRGLARTLNNLGLALSGLGRFEAAKNRFDEALEINRARLDPEAQVINYANLSEVESARGNYGESLVYLGEIRRLVAGARDEPWADRQLAVAALNRGVVLEKMGLFDDALTSYLTIDVEALSDNEQGWLALDLGVVYRNLGDPYLALRSLDLAADSARELRDARLEIFSILNAGIVLDYNLGDLAEAERRYDIALDRSRQLSSLELEIRARLYLAHLARKRGEWVRAEEEFLAISREATARDFPDAMWQASYGLALVALGHQQFLDARDWFRETFTQLDAMRAQLTSGRLGGRFATELRPVYANAVECLIRLAETEPHPEASIREAFDVAQRAKQRFTPQPAPVLRSERLDGSEKPNALDLKALQARLGRSTLIEFFATSGELFRWTLDGHGLSFRRIGGFDELARSILDLHRELSRGEPVQAALVDELSTRLLAGIPLDELDLDHLYVATDGRLGYLPFEVLKTTAGTTLVDLAPLTYLPRGTSLIRASPARKRPAPASWWFVGFANPELGTGSASHRWATRFGLGALPGAERELERALDLMPEPAIGFVGESATESALRKLEGEPMAILHIGAHTVVEEGLGVESAVLLAPSDANDGLLLPAEIGQLDLQTDLTVLAGCQTAIGLDDQSRALSDLAEAFLDGGSKGVLATLWAVDDRATEVFMGEFYEQLGKGLSSAEALQQTKRRLRSESVGAAMSDWSPYILIGGSDGSLLPRAPLWSQWTVTIFVAGLLLLFLVPFLVSVKRRSAS